MQQPPGFADKQFPNHICKLNKAIYELRQALLAWFHKLHTFLISYGFINSISDTFLFIMHKGQYVLQLLVYVDDIVVTGNNL